jgi:hypothetical protein
MGFGGLHHLSPIQLAYGIAWMRSYGMDEKGVRHRLVAMLDADVAAYCRSHGLDPKRPSRPMR